MPWYSYEDGYGNAVDMFFNISDRPDECEVDGVKFRYRFTPSSGIFVDSMEKTENLAILKAMDEQRNTMIVRNGEITGKTTRELESERVLVPIKEANIT